MVARMNIYRKEVDSMKLGAKEYNKVLFAYVRRRINCIIIQPFGNILEVMIVYFYWYVCILLMVQYIVISHYHFS